MDERGPSAKLRTGRSAGSGGTLTFMFADLRGYTAFVEEFGDNDAASLIGAFRRLVRAEVRRAGGGVVKTEGDSFYIVFKSAGHALDCAIGTFRGADQHTREHPELPIRIGIGIHAGEPVPHERQFVGSAVNIAARLTQNAEPGELLISDTVRGLLRTSSGMPPTTERVGLELKGVSDAPRAYTVDWRSAAEVRSPLPTGWRRHPVIRAALAKWPFIAAAGLALVVVVGVVLVGAVGRSSAAPPGAAARTASAEVALPPHGPLLFEAPSALGAQRLQVVSGDPLLDQARFTGEAIEIQVSAGSWLSLSVLNLAPDDFVADYAVVPVSGDGTYALWFRGSQGRQMQVQVAPPTGALTIQSARSFESSAASERVFGPASRVPPTRDSERRLVVSARGRELTVYFNGAEVAKASDAAPQGGGIGVLVNAAKDRPFTVRVTALRVYGP